MSDALYFLERENMLFFDNLFIDSPDKKQSAVLFNLLSFRRRKLSKEEAKLVKGMMEKLQEIDYFTKQEKVFYKNLVRLKQIFSDQDKQRIEDFYMQYYRERREANPYNKDHNMTIQLTQNCNMDCVYCYNRNSISERITIKTEQIDAIGEYYNFISDRLKLHTKISTISFTGGEPLFDENTINLLNYGAKKWPKAKLYILTNGLNLLKFHHLLPIEQLELVQVSLDGVAEVHMRRRKTNVMKVSMYDDIVQGIEKLLAVNVKVRIAMVLDRENYLNTNKFMEFLISKGLLGNPLLDFKYNVVTDFTNEMEIDPAFNTWEEVVEIAKHLKESLGVPVVSFFPALNILLRYIFRESSTFEVPFFKKCNVRSYDNLVFTPDGNVYACVQATVTKGIIGKYFPEKILQEEVFQRIVNSNPIFDNEKCRKCVYKYVCLGGCPVYAEAQDKELFCGVFSQTKILEKALQLALT